MIPDATIAPPGKTAEDVVEWGGDGFASVMPGDSWDGVRNENATPPADNVQETFALNVPNAGGMLRPTRRSMLRIAKFQHNTWNVMYPCNRGDHLMIGYEIGHPGKQLPQQASYTTLRNAPTNWGEGATIG